MPCTSEEILNASTIKTKQINMSMSIYIFIRTWAYVYKIVDSSNGRHSGYPDCLPLLLSTILCCKLNRSTNLLVRLRICNTIWVFTVLSHVLLLVLLYPYKSWCKLTEVINANEGRNTTTLTRTAIMSTRLLPFISILIKMVRKNKKTSRAIDSILIIKVHFIYSGYSACFSALRS